jgi:hypothetical protein
MWPWAGRRESSFWWKFLPVFQLILARIIDRQGSFRARKKKNANGKSST